MAYAEIEPFGEFRADVRSGINSSVIANGFEAIFASQFKNYKPRNHRIEDFMPKFKEERRQDKALLAAAQFSGVAAVSRELERRRLQRAN